MTKMICRFFVLHILIFSSVLIVNAQSKIRVVDTLPFKKDNLFIVDKGYENKAGKRIGEWSRVICFNETRPDSIIRITKWKNGRRKYEIVFNNGTERAVYYNNFQYNKKELWTENGMLLYEYKYSYPLNKRTRTKIYHKNGALKEKGREKEFKKVMGCLGRMPVSEKHGKWKYYDKQGKLTNVVYYKEGRRIKEKR